MSGKHIVTAAISIQRLAVGRDAEKNWQWNKAPNGFDDYA
jgi:hypothetical protein